MLGALGGGQPPADPGLGFNRNLAYEAVNDLQKRKTQPAGAAPPLAPSGPAQGNFLAGDTPPGMGIPPPQHIQASAQGAQGAPAQGGPPQGVPSQALAGWDQTKWADPSHDTTKYAVGRILAKYPPTTAGMQQAWAEIHALYPNASFDGKDSISGLPGTLGAVDVLAGASNGGSSWWWGDQGAMGQGAGGGSMNPLLSLTTAPTVGLGLDQGSSQDEYLRQVQQQAMQRAIGSY